MFIRLTAHKILSCKGRVGRILHSNTPKRMKMFSGNSILLCLMLAKYAVCERTFMTNLYSAEEHNLLRGSRVKRAVHLDSFCVKQGCCQSRNDDCSVPYPEKNSTCYCDRFCDQEPVGHIDCCPDFWLICSDMNLQNPPPTFPPLNSPSDSQGEGCFTNGLYYEDQAIIHENCNYCTCLENQWICTQHICLVQTDLIEDINAEEYGWKAGNTSDFWGMTLTEGFEYRLGTSPPSLALLSINEMTGRVSPDDEFPLFFIASYKWPAYIHGPLDQKNCAASWAFSTASVAADRIAIHSGGRFTSNLSPQHLISCDTKNQNGCSGGNIDSAWWFLRKRGLVSHACYPFIMDKTDAFVSCNISTVSDHHGRSHATTSCPNTLEDSNYIYQCSPPYRVPSNEMEIMKEIMENGPVQAVMTVHEDFFLYKTGIYKHTNLAKTKSGRHQMSGMHSIKIVGWGATGGPNRGQKFWIVANSWGRKWGENGYFRISRGKNECGIEDLIIAAWGGLRDISCYPPHREVYEEDGGYYISDMNSGGGLSRNFSPKIGHNGFLSSRNFGLFGSSK
ncbi:tubulointerstitial nephritis antigen [Pelodytes ibericus]